jgi:hypothetical protein
LLFDLLLQNFPDQIKRLQHLEIRQPVEDHIAVLADQDHTPASHHGQMLGEISDAYLKPLSQLAYAKLLLPQNIDKLKALRMGENLTQFRMVGVQLLGYGL